MKNTGLIAVIAMLVLGTTACTKDRKPEQLAALENAYQSGVLSKQEYDAKRLALMGPAPAAKPAPPPLTPPAEVPSAAPATPAQPPVEPPALRKTTVVARVQAVAKQPVALPAKAAQHTPTATSVAQPERGLPSPAMPAVKEPGLPAVQTRPALQSVTAGKAEPVPPGECADTGSEPGSGKEGHQRFYTAPLDEVKRAARAAFTRLDFNLHKDVGNDMEASKQRHISAVVGAGGERLTLHFEQFQQDNRTGTLVTGDTRKSFVGRITQKSWTNAVLAQIACQLAAWRR